jgi:hypothetical protein
VVGSEQLFFYVARHYYLTGRPNRLFFRFRGRGSGGVPGGPPGGPGGAPGGPGGVPGGPKLRFIKFYEDPKRPHNSGFWIRMTRRDDRDGRGGGPGGVPGVQKIKKKTRSKKSTSLVKISSRRDF